MTRVVRCVPAVLAAVALSAAAADGQSPPDAPATSMRCIALPLPTVRGATGSSTQGAAGGSAELAAAVRDLVTSFLTGPSLRTVALDARLATQAVEEAQQKQCGTVLTVTLTRKTSGGGGFGRALGSAANAAAWQVPYGGTATAVAARSAAVAGTAAASNLAANTRAKDELSLEYRLSSSGPGTAREGKDHAKAKADGEDLLTPLVERMATIVAGAIAP